MTKLKQVLVCAPMLMAASAHSEETLLVADAVPFIFTEQNKVQGVLYEIVHEVGLRAGHSGTVHPVPIRRQAEWGRRNAETLTTLYYTPARDAQYTWLFKLLDDCTVLAANADAPFDISSVVLAKDLRVGVILGSPSEVLVKQLGFRHVEPVTNAQNNARKLTLGRVDALATAYGAMLHVRQHFPGLPAWKTGVVLGRFSIYFGGPLGMNPERVNVWRNAFDSMKADGSYARILRKYNYAVPGAEGKAPHACDAGRACLAGAGCAAQGGQQ